MSAAEQGEEPRGSRRALFAPEVIQTSAMDCGPAALKCLLDGHGVPVSYGRLREACQTSVDGTSIDTMEQVAVQLGLDAEQIMVPLDHLLLRAAKTLPAIVVVQLANGLTHFVVVWRIVGDLVQVMDPGRGRRWTSRKRFLEEVYVHSNVVPAEGWREWAGTDGFLAPLRKRLGALGVGSVAERWISDGLADAGWRSLGALDATTRAVEAIVAGGGLRAGGQARRVLAAMLARAQSTPVGEQSAVPAVYWSVREARAPDEDGNPQLVFRGAVLVRIIGRRTHTPAGAAESAPSGEAPPPAELSPELRAALAEPPSRPGRELLRMLRGDGALAWSALLAATAAAAAGATFEVVLFRALFDLARRLGLAQQRIGAIAVLSLFVVALLFLELPVALLLRHLGRRLENGMRMAFLAKLPRLGVQYFHSRPTSDMAERSHAVQSVRALPASGGRVVRVGLELAATTAGICWLSPRSAPLAVGLALASVALPLAMQPVLSERDLRQRIHGGGLTRFYLDALMGLVAVRAHGAERAVRREHEALLVEWTRASWSRQVVATLAEALQATAGLALVVWLVFDYMARSHGAGWALLLLYWALNLPALGEELAALVRMYPAHRNVTLRLLEPLGALEDGAPPGARGEEITPRGESPPGVKIELSGVTVRAGGHTILEGVDLVIEPGSHVAVVGPSGAGKSSFVGLLLGWHQVAEGSLAIDGRALEGAALDQLRQQTAWVDPAVQLWNRTFLSNVTYGAPEDAARALPGALEAADLHGVLRRMPDGMQTTLGEGGALVSGGEGQRIRYGRALLRTGARLAILDEPFRGLDRGKRRELLARARQVWSGATFLCVTHDVGETREFDRVLVIEGGRLVEDGAPGELLARADSRYGAMLAAEAELRGGMWSSSEWRRLWFQDGRVKPREPEEPS